MSDVTRITGSQPGIAATDLRSRTQGRGSFTMHFGRYEEVPGSLAEEIVNRVQGKVTR